MHHRIRQALGMNKNTSRQRLAIQVRTVFSHLVSDILVNPELFDDATHGQGKSIRKVRELKNIMTGDPVKSFDHE